ncbi:MAG: TraR/DksA C4-type zinc finger protein [Planctomycetota bacterium]|nr:MAG: TraR/DksA C4-type zinc finger protein [Planctomycetota bacterium]
MPKKVTTSKAGQKKNSPKASASESKTKTAKSAGRTKARAQAEASNSASRSLSSKKTAKAAAKTKNTNPKNVKKTKTSTAGKKRSTSKKGNNNGLLPKVPVKPTFAQKPLKLRKTRLKPEELEEFRQMLIEKRREAVGDINHLHSEAKHQGSSGEINSGSTMPIHMADIGSDTWEQELTMGLIENEQTLIREIDEAIDRIDNKTYGVCLATNRSISKSRLRARPWAKYCIEYARQRELGLV